jgi:prepilin-type N-terminal cleavage/methylation domain-containing protein
MKQNARVRGFTMVEVMIAISILAILLFMVYMSLHRTSDMYAANSKRAWILHQGRVALDEIAEGVRQGNRLNLKGAIAPPTDGVEGGVSNTVSFVKITKPDAVTKKVAYNKYYTSYFWQLSDDTYTVADPGNPAVVAPAPIPPYKLPGATWVDANNNNIKDEGRLVRTDPNPDDSGVYSPAHIMCNYLKNDPFGFQVRQTYQTVNLVKQSQIRITLVLVFTDDHNKVQEETLETIVFLRNSQ